MTHSRLIDAFVDNTSLGNTDPGLLTLERMIEKLNRMAQTWAQLLYYSGGALNLAKCLWHIMYWAGLAQGPASNLSTRTDRPGTVPHHSRTHLGCSDTYHPSSARTSLETPGSLSHTHGRFLSPTQTPERQSRHILCSLKLT